MRFVKILRLLIGIVLLAAMAVLLFEDNIFQIYLLSRSLIARE